MNEAFDGFWADLCDYYGKKPNASVTFEYKQEANGVPASKRSEFFRHIIHTYDFFPRLSEFAATCAKFKVVPKEKVYNEKCVYCLGGGLLKYNRKIEGLNYKPEYYAACVCEKGRNFKGNPVFGIEQIWGDKTEEILGQLAERNGGKKNVSELKESFERSLDIMDMRNQAFSKA